MLSGNFYGSEIRLLGVKFWSRDFWGFYLKPKGFFGVFIFAPIGTSLSLEIRSTLPPGGDQHEISPCNINALKNGVVMRIEYMIWKDESN